MKQRHPALRDLLTYRVPHANSVTAMRCGCKTASVAEERSHEVQGRHDTRNALTAGDDEVMDLALNHQSCQVADRRGAQHNAAAATGRRDRVIIKQACSGWRRQTLHCALSLEVGYRFLGSWPTVSSAPECP